MIKHLQNLSFKNIDTQNKAKVDMYRGTFVKVNDLTKELEVASTTADVQGVVVRDVIVTTDVAMGFPVSDWDVEQDLVKAGTYAGLETIHKGERYVTDQYGDVVALPEADAVAGKVLDVVNGKLVKAVASSTSKIVSLGFQTVAGHRVLGFKLV